MRRSRITIDVARELLMPCPVCGRPATIWIDKERSTLGLHFYVPICSNIDCLKKHFTWVSYTSNLCEAVRDWNRYWASYDIVYGK